MEVRAEEVSVRVEGTDAMERISFEVCGLVTILYWAGVAICQTETGCPRKLLFSFIAPKGNITRMQFCLLTLIGIFLRE